MTPLIRISFSCVDGEQLNRTTKRAITCRLCHLLIDNEGLPVDADDGGNFAARRIPDGHTVKSFGQSADILSGLSVVPGIGVWSRAAFDGKVNSTRPIVITACCLNVGCKLKGVVLFNAHRALGGADLGNCHCYSVITRAYIRKVFCSSTVGPGIRVWLCTATHCDRN